MTRSEPTVKAVILDMDGTLVDTEKLFKESWFACAKLFNFEFNDQHYLKLLGRPLETSMHYIQSLLPMTIPLNQFMDTLFKDQQARQLKQGIQFRPGAIKLLQLLIDSPYLTGLVTSSKRETITKNFKALPFNPEFDVLISYEDTQLHKPNPDPYLKACHTLQIKPINTLVVEDSSIGAQASIDAGCVTVLVPQLVQPNLTIKSQLFAVYDSLHDVIKQLSL